MNRRQSNVRNTDRDVILNLQRMLHEHNPYVKMFKTALERMPTNDYKVVIHGDRTPAGEHDRRYNAPNVNEVAVIITNEQRGPRDIVLEKQNAGLQRINELHYAYDALQYPLIFWKGEDGYHINLKQVDPVTHLPTNKSLSCVAFYSYRFMVRDTSNCNILMYRQLTNQLAADMYAKAESERLRYLNNNQSKLRSEQYAHLRDAIQNENNAGDIGRRVILPSSFIGGPRHMNEYTQDAMTYVRKYGTPDLFITFTCNPKWEEIQNELLNGQKPCDRHDIISRVFRLKVATLIHLLIKGKLFGERVCFMYTIEWQKRGLPHAHILLWLKTKIRAPEIDLVISAEIPDENTDPILHKIVTDNMIHGPCGVNNPEQGCMVNGKCSKNFPKAFVNETQSEENGYPQYRRRNLQNGGKSISLRKSVGNGKFMRFEVDNRWVVPYCPTLSKIFNAHINVEFCNSVKSIKYICKYVNKGSDQAIISVEGPAPLEQVNEIEQFREGRYICSSEAFWRIYEFPIHER